MTNNFINGQNFKSIFDENNPLSSINQLSDKLYELRYKANAGRSWIRTKNDLAIEYEAVKTQVEQLQNVVNSKLRYEPAKEIFEKIEESTNYLQEVLSGLDYKIVQTYYNDILDLTDDLIDLTEENTRDINVIDDVKNIQEYIKKSAKKIRNLKDFEHVLNDIPIEVKTLRKDNKTIQEITIRDPKKPLPKDSLAEYKTKNYIIKYDPEIIFDPEDVFLDFYEETIKDNVVKINKVETNNVFSRTKSSSIIDQIEKQGKNKIFIRDKSKKWHQYNPFNNDRNFINNLPIVTNKLINEDTVSYYNIPNIFGFLNTTLTNKDLLRFKNVIKKTNIEKRLIPLTRVDIPNNELIKQITGLPQVSTPEQFKMGIYESDKIKINFEPIDLITERTSKISKNPKYNFLGFTGNLRIDINDKRLFDKLKNNKFITENYELIDKDDSRSLIIKNFKLSKQDVDVVEKVMESNRKGIVSPITEGRISRFSNVLNRLGIRSNKPLWSKNESGLFFDIETVGNKNLSIGFARYLSPTSNQDFKISILNQNLSDEELLAVIRTKSLDEYSNIGNIIQRMRANKLTNIEFNGIHYYLQDLDSPESIDEVFKRIKQDINVDFFKPNIQNFIGGYNIKDFDIPILQQKLGQSKAISNLLRLPVTDVYDNIQGLLQRKGINLTSYSQENVQKALGININKLHVDIHDAITTAEIAKKISNLKPFNFKELFTKFIVNTGLSKEIINTDISQTGVKTNYHSSRYFSKKNKRDEIYYSDLAEEFLNKDFRPNMFGRNYNVIKDKKHNFYTEYKGKNFINVQKDYAGNFSLFESYDDSSKLFATNAILQKQNELKYYDQAEFIKTKMELRRKINLNKRHEPLTMLLTIPIEEFERNDYTQTYEIKVNTGKIFKSIKNSVIERFTYEDREDLIEKFFNKSDTINISINDFKEFIEALNAEKDLLIKNLRNQLEKNIDLKNYNQESYLKALNKKINLLEKINFEETIKIQTDKDIIMNQKEFIENIKEDKNLIIAEETLWENLIESGRQKVEIERKVPKNIDIDLSDFLPKTDVSKLQFLVHYNEFKTNSILEKQYSENLKLFKSKFTRKNLLELINQLNEDIQAEIWLISQENNNNLFKELKDLILDLNKTLENEKKLYPETINIFQKYPNLMNELINIGIDTENEKKSFILDALGLFEVTESDEYYIKNKINELKSVINNINELEDIAKKSRSYNQFATVAIKNYRFNQALNLIDFIKDEKIKSKFQQFATERIQQLYDTNQQKFISTFMSNVQQFIINYQTYNKLNSFNQETSWNEQISKQIYDLEYMPNNELIKLDYNSLSNQGLLKMYIDIQKGNKFRSFYKQQLEQIEGQKGVVEFEFNNQKFRINQSKQPKNPVERLKWFIKNYESKSNYRYGKNTINNYVLSELFRGKEIFDVKNLEFMDFILNLKSYSPTQIEEKIQKFIDVGLLKGNPLISKLPGKKYTDAFENENIKVLIADILEQVDEKYYDLTLNEYILLKNNNDPNLFTSLLEPLVHNKKRNFLDDFFEINNITEDEMLETLADPSSIRPIFLSVQEFYGENIRKGFLTKELKIKNQKISNYKINELIFSHFYNQAQNSDFKQSKTLIENLQTLNEMFHRGGKKDYTKYIEQTKTRKNLVFDLQDIINDVINSKEKNVKTNDITNFFSNKQFIDKFQEFFVQKKFYSNIYEDLDKNDYLMSFIDKKTEELFGDINIKSKKYSIIENKYKDLLYKHVGRNKRQANTIIDDELNVVFKDYFKTLNQYKQLLYEFLDKNEKQTNQIITNEIIRKIKYHKKLNPNISKLFNKYALDELKEINPQLYNELITKLTKDFDITKYNEHIMLNYKVGDTIYIDGESQIIKEINPITGIKVQKGGKIYTLVDNKKTSAKGNYQDILVNEAKQIKQINEELKPFVENLEKFQPKISEADNFFKFHAVAREQIRYYKRNSEYMSLFINNKEKIQKQIGLDPNSDVMNNLIKFLQTHKDLISQYSLSNQQVDEYLRNNFIQKEEIPELTSYLSPTNLQKIRGYVKTNATLDKTNVQVSIKGHLETDDIKVIERFINQLSIFNDINELFKSGNTTKDYLKKLNEIEDLNKTDDVLETKIIIKNLDNYVENLRRVFEINDKRLNELFNLYYSQSTNKQKLYLVNQIEHNLAINKNSVVWNLIGQENFKTINDFLEEHSDNVINNIRYLYQLLKEKSNSKTKLDDEILYFIQNIMSRSYQKKIPNTIIQKHIYSNGLENQEFIIPMSEDLLSKETNRKINDPTFQEMLNKLVNPDEENIKEAIQKSQMEKNLNKINYKKLGAWGQGIAAVTGLITLGTVQKRKQEKKQQTVYPQQVQANGDYYLNQELPNPEYGFDIRQLQQMPDQAVEELIYQLSDLKRDKLVNLYKTYQF